MSLEPLSYYRFRNEVPTSGYAWVEDWELAPNWIVDGGRGDPPFMVSASAIAETVECYVETRFPLRDAPGLYREFAELEHGRDAFLRFANRYGCLVNSEVLIHPQTSHVVPASPSSLFSKELCAMKIARHLWNAIRREDHRELARHFYWVPGTFSVRIVIGVAEDGSIVLPDFRPNAPTERLLFSDIEWLVKPVPERQEMMAFGPGASWKHGEILGPARLTVLKYINKRIEKYCHPRLYLDRDGRHVGLITPDNLLGCLWLQFYQEVAGLQKLRQCAICHKEMDVSDNRSHKRVHAECSTRERTRKLRARRKENAPE